MGTWVSSRAALVEVMEGKKLRKRGKEVKFHKSEKKKEKKHRSALRALKNKQTADSSLPGGGEAMAEQPLFDWKEAFRLTFGEGLSDPASLELVVCPDELLDSTDQDDMSKDLGLEVFILTLLSRVLTLKGEKFIDFKLNLQIRFQE